MRAMIAHERSIRGDVIDPGSINFRKANDDMKTRLQISLLTDDNSRNQ